MVDQHIDHVRRRVAQPEGDPSTCRSSDAPILPGLDHTEDSDNSSPDLAADVENSPAPSLRRSARDRHPPERFM